ncbi:hypothetical protein QBC45DRAFT_409401 [Copromyces sp. CBS 386.78]|nr:hypothetical protein QBC45DRAFT_409401 [Copromyces sp. CBS 386.78]
MRSENHTPRPIAHFYAFLLKTVLGFWAYIPTCQSSQIRNVNHRRMYSMSVLPNWVREDRKIILTSYYQYFPEH